MVGSRRMSLQPLVAATPRYHSHALCYRSLASAQSVTRTKQRQAVFRRPAPLGGLSPSPGFLVCLQDFEFPMCHTLSVPRLRRVVHLVVHVLAPFIYAGSIPLSQDVLNTSAPGSTSLSYLLSTAIIVTVFPTPLLPINTA